MINKKSVLIAVWAALLLIFLTACSKTYTVTFDTNGGMRTAAGSCSRRLRKAGALFLRLSKNRYRFVSWNDVISRYTVTKPSPLSGKRYIRLLSTLPEGLL